MITNFKGLEYPRVKIYQQYGKKFIAFEGYGYYAENDREAKPYRFVHYSEFEARLTDVLKIGFLEYERRHLDNYILTLDDVNVDELNAKYLEGNPKQIPEEEVSENIPDGEYVIIYKKGGST